MKTLSPIEFGYVALWGCVLGGIVLLLAMAL